MLSSSFVTHFWLKEVINNIWIYSATDNVLALRWHCPAEEGYQIMNGMGLEFRNSLECHRKPWTKTTFLWGNSAKFLIQGWWGEINNGTPFSLFLIAFFNRHAFCFVFFLYKSAFNWVFFTNRRFLFKVMPKIYFNY